MEINRKDEGKKTILSLVGRLDTTTAPRLEASLIPEFDKAETIELDFSGLIYVSSAGLRVLILGEKASKAKGVKMTITNVSDEIMEVFNMTGFNKILNFV